VQTTGRRINLVIHSRLLHLCMLIHAFRSIQVEHHVDAQYRTTCSPSAVTLSWQHFMIYKSGKLVQTDLVFGLRSEFIEKSACACNITSIHVLCATLWLTHGQTVTHTQLLTRYAISSASWTKIDDKKKINIYAVQYTITYNYKHRLLTMQNAEFLLS